MNIQLFVHHKIINQLLHCQILKEIISKSEQTLLIPTESKQRYLKTEPNTNRNKH